MIDIRIQAEPFNIASEQESLWREHPQVGALVTFVGLMRNMNEGHRVSRMILEHYPGMTEKALTAIAEDAVGRWDLQGIRILHRVGELEPQDPIVLVAVTSAHRGDAFRACELLIDYLKTRAPFWKKEILEGGERWVDARVTDETAAQRWVPARGATPEENGRQSVGSGVQDASNADKKRGQSAWEILSEDGGSGISDV
jgi:molybdopterin synthase catalytic subunit